VDTPEAQRLIGGPCAEKICSQTRALDTSRTYQETEMTNTLPIFTVLIVGIGATALVDLWAILQRPLFAAPPTNWCFVGRWVGYLPRGQFTHPNMAQTPPLKGECLMGWLTHYVTGIVFATAFLLLVGSAWIAQPTLYPALVFGLVTVVFPFFILQPGLGAGIAASKAPSPASARLRAVLNHGVFGVGLYLSALLWTILL
jgi:hypothetical protein